MNKTNHPFLVSSLVLLTFLLVGNTASAQMPKPFIHFMKAQNNIKSGYVKMQHTSIVRNDDDGDEDAEPSTYVEEAFFVLTPKDMKYLVYSGSSTYCKSAGTTVGMHVRERWGDVVYSYKDSFKNAKNDIDFRVDFAYKPAFGFSLERWVWTTGKFQKIPPKISKNNVRYQVIYPDNFVITGKREEWEFDKKTFHWVASEDSATCLKTMWTFSKTEVLESRLYDYIHPDILDTISFKYEEIKRGYDRQCAVKQAKKDSLFRETVIKSVAESSGSWVENLPQDRQKDTVYFMPDWKYPLLGGDSISPDDIRSRFLLIDMWYMACPPCLKVMRDMSGIDTLYDESLLKIVSLNVGDKDTVKIREIAEKMNVKNDIACTFDTYHHVELSEKMGGCQGFPQLFLINMETRQVIWRSCGWHEGFMKEIGETLNAEKEKR